jgi:hypothetical protein
MTPLAVGLRAGDCHSTGLKLVLEDSLEDRHGGVKRHCRRGRAEA